jgi:polyribonucleotide nucleotidyltransferase
VGKEKRKVTVDKTEDCLVQTVKDITWNKLKEAVIIKSKTERRRKVKEIQDAALEDLLPEYEGREGEIKGIMEEEEREIIRDLVIKEKKRIDGRAFDEIRPITCEVGLLPRTHGSALFTRGETQALVVTTLGTSNDEQRIDSLSEETTKSFMLHYNFPPFCVNEVRPLRGPSRREIGHGALAERAIVFVLPDNDQFPYTIRIVSEIMESNGSSSMATVCGSSLSLMDAGVPIKAPVAGIAMGLIKEGGKVVILSDILGDEDHAGDMDFKVVGTTEGITALQMDIKVGGITREILEKTLSQAREGRLFILEEMKRAIEEPRDNISVYAPRIVTFQINPDKIAEVIGPRGKVIKGIIEETGAKIEVEDSGKISVASSDDEATKKAIEMIKSITQEAEIGEVYLGKVKKIVDFGAFVEIFSGTDGLVHISQLAHERVKSVADVLKEGDKVLVKVIDIDQQGKIKLSRKAALGQIKTR